MIGPAPDPQLPSPAASPVDPQINAIPDVVVVVPNLNGATILASTLAAIAPAAGSLTCRTVVVDNGSTDDSAELVRREFPEVLLVVNPENRGFAVACNQGGRAIASRHVLLLNSDVTLTPGSLARLVAELDAHDRLGALTPAMTWPDGRHQGRKLPWWRSGDRVPVPAVSGTCLLLRRAALDCVGWLDERFFFYNEDLDLSIRLRKARWEIACLRSVRVPHREGQATRSSVEVQARAILEGYRGGVLLVRKHYPWAAGLTRWGILVLLRAQRLHLACKRGLKVALTDREVALALCLERAPAALARDAD